MSMPTSTPLYRKNTVEHGPDADKEDYPRPGQEYNADDTETEYTCFKEGIWKAGVSEDENGVLFYDNKQIIPAVRTNETFSTGVFTCSEQRAGFTMTSEHGGFLTGLYYKNTAGSGTATIQMNIKTEAGERNITFTATGGTERTTEITPSLPVKKGETVQLINNGNCYSTTQGQTISLIGDSNYLMVI